MQVAVLTAELLFPGAGSLKDKRRRLAGLTARIRASYPVSVAEVAHQELWQRAALTVAVVSTERAHAEQPWTFRRPIAAGACAVFLARKDDAWHTFALIFHRRIEDGHHFA